MSGGRRHALGGAGEAGRSPPWSIRRCWANGSAWGPVDGDWPNNNDIIRPTGPAASPLKWGKIQLYKGIDTHLESIQFFGKI